MTVKRSGRRSMFFGLAAMLAAGSAGAGGNVGSSASCAWSEDFAPVGIDGRVNALEVFDGELYSGGLFDRIGRLPVANLARWNGERWLPLGLGTDGEVRAFARFDDGGGEKLYVGGQFGEAGGQSTGPIARFDGTLSPVGAASAANSNGAVLALATFDDGGGEALYAAGTFDMIGGVAASGIARFDGSGWSAVAGGLGGGATGPRAEALAVFDAGGGPALFVGGEFDAAGGVAADNLARFDGASWSSIGSADAPVTALLPVDTPGGPRLYIGGLFNTIGGGSLNVAIWDGATMLPAGDGLHEILGYGFPDGVFGFVEWDDGGGTSIYALGLFRESGLTEISPGIARWDGTDWQSLAAGFRFALPSSQLTRTAAVFDDGTGSALFIGGDFSQTDDAVATGIVRFDGSSFAPVGATTHGLVGGVRDMAALDAGSGPELVVSGEFLAVQGANGAIRHVARRTPTGAWLPLAGTGTELLDRFGSSTAISVFDDGSGPAVYLAATYQTNVVRLLRWDDAGWTLLDESPAPSTLERHASMVVWDDGGGDDLYVGGFFGSIGGVAADDIARWDGTAWSPVGASFAFAPIEDLAVFDDGGGPTLWAIDNGASGDSRLLRFDGAAWSVVVAEPMGGGFPEGRFEALEVYDDGRGPALYVGGNFDSIGGVAANNLGRFDGTGWSSVGDGPGNSFRFTWVSALEVIEEPGGAALYAVGEFSRAAPGGLFVENAARWDGVAWSALGPESSPGVGPLGDGLFLEGVGPTLFVGGKLTRAGSRSSSGLAAWTCLDLVFSDGFESGDTSVWATGIP